MRFFTAIALLLLLSSACTTTEPEIDQSTPEAATKGFFEALNQGHYDLAGRYGTDATDESVRHFKTNLKMVSEEEKKVLTAPFEVPLDKVSCTEQQGNTVCTVVYQNQQEVRAELVQRNDKWFVQMELNF